MARILLTHTPDVLANYYGERALAGLRALGEVRINPTGNVLDGAAFVEAARGCEIIVSDRQTPGPAEFFRAAPDLAAFLRCAVDIRSIDVDAASAAGVLVTRASPGFAASVAEMARRHDGGSRARECPARSSPIARGRSRPSRWVAS